MAKVSETIPVLYCPGNHDLGDKGGRKDDESDYVKRFGADYYSFWYGGVRGLVLNTHLWASPTANPERRRAQERWFDQELAVAQLNAHHLIIVGHHPWFLRDPYEEEHPIWTPIPKATRLRWLAKMGHCKVKIIFSGHCHRNYEAKIKRAVSASSGTTDASNADEALSLSHDLEGACIGRMPSVGDGGSPVEEGKGRGGAKREGIEADGMGEGHGGGGDPRTAGDVDSEDEPGAISDNENDEQLNEVDMRSIVTSSCTAPLGPDPPGFRVVRVFSRRIKHEYFSLDSPPLEVDIAGNGDD